LINRIVVGNVTPIISRPLNEIEFKESMNTREILKSENGIFNLLLIKLYTRQLQPGDKLPSLKAFAKELDVDQASLRVALKQLEMMNLIDIRRSNGFYIQDFREKGGLDFLTSLFFHTGYPGKSNHPGFVSYRRNSGILDRHLSGDHVHGQPAVSIS
jgi:hypothetical protein